MFENFILVGAIIAIFWVVVFAIYLYTSRQQRSIAEEIDVVQEKLDKNSDES